MQLLRRAPDIEAHVSALNSEANALRISAAIGPKNGTVIAGENSFAFVSEGSGQLLVPYELLCAYRIEASSRTFNITHDSKVSARRLVFSRIFFSGLVGRLVSCHASFSHYWRVIHATALSLFFFLGQAASDSKVLISLNDTQREVAEFAVQFDEKILAFLRAQKRVGASKVSTFLDTKESSEGAAFDRMLLDQRVSFEETTSNAALIIPGMRFLARWVLRGTIQRSQSVMLVASDHGLVIMLPSVGLFTVIYWNSIKSYGNTKKQATILQIPVANKKRLFVLHVLTEAAALEIVDTTRACIVARNAEGAVLRPLPLMYPPSSLEGIAEGRVATEEAAQRNSILVQNITRKRAKSFGSSADNSQEDLVVPPSITAASVISAAEKQEHTKQQQQQQQQEPQRGRGFTMAFNRTAIDVSQYDDDEDNDLFEGSVYL